MILSVLMMISWTTTSLYPLNSASSGRMSLFTSHTTTRSIFILSFFVFGFLFFGVFLGFLSSSEEMSMFGLFPEGLMSGFGCSPFIRLISSRNFWFSTFNFSTCPFNSSISWRRMRKASDSCSSWISSGRIFIVSNVCTIPDEFMRRPLLFCYI